MNVLIFEDEEQKYEVIQNFLNNISDEIIIKRVEYLTDFAKLIERMKFDLVILDLVAKCRNSDTETANLALDLVGLLRDIECKNFKTPAIALTQYEEIADETYKILNNVDITVHTFDITHEKWKDFLKGKILNYIPIKNYDFIIVCALKKEANAYQLLNDSQLNSLVINTKQVKTVEGLTAFEISLSNNLIGIVVKQPKMGLVNTSITVSKLLTRYNPKLISMSGICAGIEDKVKICDLIVPSECYQHDSGKWDEFGFKVDFNMASLPQTTISSIEVITESNEYQKYISLSKEHKKIILSKPCTQIGITSSGSAVIANTQMSELVSSINRKTIAFEMESFALYEAIKQLEKDCLFYSIKAVVDNGNESKSNDFQEIGCLISAKANLFIIDKLLSK